ncbi:MAG: hypothetical protein JW937_08125 [Candidatus Omnitrophica bacterium]|nr:hypothetical protein [Candidatus Omnitrophota bacterium]
MRNPRSPGFRFLALILAQVFLWTSIHPVFAAPSRPQFVRPVQSNLSPEAPVSLPALQKVIAHSGAENLDVSALQIPAEIGRVVERRKNPLARQIVVHIQDLHANPEAQNNIAEILRYLYETYGMAQVGLEGSEGPIDTFLFSTLPNEEVRREWAGQALAKALITGPEKICITDRIPLELLGVEDRAKYIGDFRAFREIHSVDSGVLQSLQDFQNQAEALGNVLYPAGARELVRAYRGFAEGEVGMETHFGLLRATAGELGIDLQISYPTLAAFFRLQELQAFYRPEAFKAELTRVLDRIRTGDAAPREQEEIIAAAGLLASGSLTPGQFAQHLLGTLNFATQGNTDYPQMTVMAEIESLGQHLKPQELIQEQEALQNDLLLSFLEDEDQKALYHLQKRIEIVGKLLRAEAGPAEWEVYQSNRALCRGVALVQSLQEIQERQGIWDMDSDIRTRALEWDRALLSAQAFYTVAEERNPPLVENFLRHLQEGKERLGVLITGGFHSVGVTQILEQSNISFVVVVPKVTHLEDSGLYLERMMALNIGPEQTGIRVARRAADTETLAIPHMLARSPIEDQAGVLNFFDEQLGEIRRMLEEHYGPEDQDSVQRDYEQWLDALIGQIEEHPEIRNDLRDAYIQGAQRAAERQWLEWASVQGSGEEQRQAASQVLALLARYPQPFVQGVILSAVGWVRRNLSTEGIADQIRAAMRGGPITRRAFLGGAAFLTAGLIIGLEQPLRALGAASELAAAQVQVPPLQGESLSSEARAIVDDLVTQFNTAMDDINYSPVNRVFTREQMTEFFRAGITNIFQARIAGVSDERIGLFFLPSIERIQFAQKFPDGWPLQSAGMTLLDGKNTMLFNLDFYNPVRGREGQEGLGFFWAWDHNGESPTPGQLASMVQQGFMAQTAHEAVHGYQNQEGVRADVNGEFLFEPDRLLDWNAPRSYDYPQLERLGRAEAEAYAVAYLLAGEERDRWMALHQSDRNDEGISFAGVMAQFNMGGDWNVGEVLWGLTRLEQEVQAVLGAGTHLEFSRLTPVSAEPMHWATFDLGYFLEGEPGSVQIRFAVPAEELSYLPDVLHTIPVQHENGEPTYFLVIEQHLGGVDLPLGLSWQAPAENLDEKRAIQAPEAMLASLAKHPGLQIGKDSRTGIYTMEMLLGGSMSEIWRGVQVTLGTDALNEAIPHVVVPAAEDSLTGLLAEREQSIPDPLGTARIGVERIESVDGAITYVVNVGESYDPADIAYAYDITSVAFNLVGVLTADTSATIAVIGSQRDGFVNEFQNFAQDVREGEPPGTFAASQSGPVVINGIRFDGIVLEVGRADAVLSSPERTTTVESIPDTLSVASVELTRDIVTARELQALSFDTSDPGTRAAPDSIQTLQTRALFQTQIQSSL